MLELVISLVSYRTSLTLASSEEHISARGLNESCCKWMLSLLPTLCTVYRLDVTAIYVVHLPTDNGF